MTAHLICRRDSEVLETMVFSSGNTGVQDAVAMFTELDLADAYIENAGWSDDYTVAVLEPLPFLRWLLRAFDDGIQHVIVDPVFAKQQAGEAFDALSIEETLKDAGKHIIRVARLDF